MHTEVLPCRLLDVEMLDELFTQECYLKTNMVDAILLFFYINERCFGLV